MTQLTIEFDIETVADRTIGRLLNLLNYDRKKPFRLVRKIKHQDYLIAHATDGEIEVYNIVNSKGQAPQNFSVNWRNKAHINNELIELAV